MTEGKASRIDHEEYKRSLRKESSDLIMKKIKRNAIRCKKCGEVIESKSRHDFQTCSCGAVSVDGGLCYLRRCFKQGIAGDSYEELAEYYEEEDDGNIIE